MAETCTFTPMQRRHYVFPREVRSSDDARIWTAARCQRLLRPFTSRLEVLKKESMRSKTSNPKSTERVCVQLDRPVISPQVRESSPQTKEKDPEWDPTRKRVRPKRTYAGHARPALETNLQRSGRSNLAPGEISIPTPLLNRVNPERVPVVQSCPSAAKGAFKALPGRRSKSRCGAAGSEAHFQHAEDMRRIRKSTPHNRYALYEGLYNALDSLIKATTTDSPGNGPQSQSLLSMCLRRVSDHIRVEENWLASETKKSALDQSDVSAEVYSYLECLGASNKGWRHLKTVVRAHGINLISEAISESLIDTRFASAMVILCAHTASPSEAELLLSSLLTANQYPEPVSVHTSIRDNAKMLPLGTLMTFVHITGRTALYHRNISQLIAKRLLPESWLATRDFGVVWTTVFRSLSEDVFLNTDSWEFLINVLPRLCTKKTDENKLSLALDATLASATRIIATMCILKQENPSSSSSLECSRLANLLMSIVIDCGLSYSTLDGPNVALIALSILAISGSSNLDINGNSDFFAWLIETVKEGSCEPHSVDISYEEYLSEFIYSIARCCGRCSTDNGFQQLKSMLRNMSGIDSLKKDHILRRVTVGAAFAFSQHVPNQKHLDYFEEVDVEFPAPDTVSMTSPSTFYSQKQSFRWEEGISEWVTATPALSSHNHRILEFPSSDSESGGRLPHRPSSKRQGKSYPSVLERLHFQNSQSSPSELVSPSLDICTDENYAESTLRAVENGLDRAERSHSGHVPIRMAQVDIRETGSRKHVTKMRRLGHELLRTRQEWSLFDDESDDELNSSALFDVSSPTSSRNPQNCGRFSIHRPSKKRCRRRGTASTLNSEDELCLP